MGSTKCDTLWQGGGGSLTYVHTGWTTVMFRTRIKPCNIWAEQSGGLQHSDFNMTFSADFSTFFKYSHGFTALMSLTSCAARWPPQYAPAPADLDFWPFDLEVGVGVACDLGYPCAKFRLSRPFGFRVRADVRDIRQTDRWTTNADVRLIMAWRHSFKAQNCTFVV